jgi:carbonic anhydrase/acetyltransferase-like protein (isoleucine patch superfamily)
MKESLLKGLLNRVLQECARVLPGAQSLRVALHRARGVKVGKNVWIGYDVVLDTSQPSMIDLQEGCVVNMRVTILAHFREVRGVTVEPDAFIGAGALILPGVVIGKGAVVAAGSVVTRSVAAFTMVQGNPAMPVAKCGIPLGTAATLKEFTRNLRPLTSKTPPSAATQAQQPADEPVTESTV